MLIWIIIGLAIILVDQLAKFLVLANMSATSSIHVIPKVIDFVFVKNTGAAFSILSNNTIFLGIISVLFCIGVVIYWYVKKPQDKLFLASLTLLFSGAFGNAIDRLFRGYVVDFISTTFIKFPVFNVADIAITIGATILVVYLLFFDNKEVENEKDNSSDNKSE